MEALGADPTTTLADFFKGMASALGNDTRVQLQCQMAAQTLAARLALVSVSDIRARTPSLQLMKDIMSTARLPDNYVPALEQWLQIKFVPMQTAAETGGGARGGVAEDDLAAAAQQKKRNGYRNARFMTPHQKGLGAVLTAAGRIGELVLPAGILEGMPPPGSVINFKNMVVIAERIVVWTVVTYGYCHIDGLWKLQVVPQLSDAYPVVCPGKAGTKTAGVSREWGDVIKNRFANSRKEDGTSV